MITSCPCQHCGGKLEFEADNFEESHTAGGRIFGQTITCPHCEQTTALYLTARKAVEQAAHAGAVKYKTLPPLWQCPDCAKLISRRATDCPQCGAPLPIKMGLFRLVFNVTGIVLVMLVLFGLVLFAVGFVVGDLATQAGSGRGY